MNTTQTLAIAADLADLLDLPAPVPATEAALAEWRRTVSPASSRTEVSLAARPGTYAVTRAASVPGAALAAAAVMTGVGAMLLSALSSVVGA